MFGKKLNSLFAVQHKKLSVEGGGPSKDFRKGQKQGDLQIWDPVDKVGGLPRWLLPAGFSLKGEGDLSSSPFSNGGTTTA